MTALLLVLLAWVLLAVPLALTGAFALHRLREAEAEVETPATAGAASAEDGRAVEVA
ncbi:MAG: hypothetical protein JWN17_691 [Frankiales bacterium]|nr:hypothetical protein [Frankiales bacterium]